MKKVYGVLAALFACIAVSLFTMPALAASIDPDVSDPDLQIPASSNEPDVRPEWGGDNIMIHRIPGCAFQPQDNSQTTGYYFGSIYPTEAPQWFWAPVYLPGGAKIIYMIFYYYDINASMEIEVQLKRYYGNDSVEYLTDDFTTGTPGFGSTATVGILNHTVDNWTNQYLVSVNIPAWDGTLMLRSVVIMYQLQISPAPGYATFSDVPVGSTWHQYVEALAASGITTGYGDGTFRPDNPVTRGQMAAFLSRALGISWTFY